MPNLSPQVSVIIPCYNYARYLPDAINSVLLQHVENGVEIIVVDDGSTDATAQAANNFGTAIRYIHQENQGLSAARNTGMRAARGDFMVFLDADDLLYEGNLNAQLANFSAHPELDISVCHSVQIAEDSNKSSLWALKGAHLDLHLCHSNIAPVHTFMIRSQCAAEAGFFDPSLKACEDYDFWLRCAAQGKKFASNPASFVIYRQHERSMTTHNARQLAYDSAVRSKIGQLLATVPKFPRAGKYHGWLAYACGCMGSAGGIYSFNPKYALELVGEAASAILNAAKTSPKQPSADRHLLNVERYFSGSCLELARSSNYNAVPSLKKAVAFLGARHPDLAQLTTDALHTRTTNLYRRLLCDTRDIQADLRTIGII